MCRCNTLEMQLEAARLRLRALRQPWYDKELIAQAAALEREADLAQLSLDCPDCNEASRAQDNP